MIGSSQPGGEYIPKLPGLKNNFKSTPGTFLGKPAENFVYERN
jgi:hypothetical protein